MYACKNQMIEIQFSKRCENIKYSDWNYIEMNYFFWSSTCFKIEEYFSRNEHDGKWTEFILKLIKIPTHTNSYETLTSVINDINILRVEWSSKMHANFPHNWRFCWKETFGRYPNHPHTFHLYDHGALYLPCLV